MKVCAVFVFGLQTLELKDFSKIYQFKCLKPKNKGNMIFYECCDLTEKVYLTCILLVTLIFKGVSSLLLSNLFFITYLVVIMAKANNSTKNNVTNPLKKSIIVDSKNNSGGGSCCKNFFCKACSCFKIDLLITPTGSLKIIELVRRTI